MNSNQTAGNWDLWDESMMLMDNEELKEKQRNESVAEEDAFHSVDQEGDSTEAVKESMEKITQSLESLRTEQKTFWHIFNQCSNSTEFLQFELNKWMRKLENLQQDIIANTAVNCEMATTGDHSNNLNAYTMCIKAAQIDGEGLLAAVQGAADESSSSSSGGGSSSNSSGEILRFRIDRLKKNMQQQQSKVQDKETQSANTAKLVPRQVKLPEAASEMTSIHSTQKEM